MLHIEPIKLLSGTHADTGATGQGCFMNVIAYLNGEPQITDDSPCVCFTVKKFVIGFNDRLLDKDRHELIPFIERAMGSVTMDKIEINRRLKILRDQAGKTKAFAIAIAYANANAYANAIANADAYANANANAYANAEENPYLGELVAPYQFYKKLGIETLDEMLPKKVEYNPVVYLRAEKLLELAR
jgi:hypothetical protein